MFLLFALMKGLLYTMNKKLKHSNQRDIILNFLSTRTDHPTADFIYENVRKEIPNISLGTVYRNLSLLSETGQIQKINCDVKSDHYDPNTKNHYHFFCHQCSSVIDVDIPVTSILLDEARNSFEGQIDSHCVVFYGVCSKCIKENN